MHIFLLFISTSLYAAFLQNIFAPKMYEAIEMHEQKKMTKDQEVVIHATGTALLEQWNILQLLLAYF